MQFIYHINISLEKSLKMFQIKFCDLNVLQIKVTYLRGYCLHGLCPTVNLIKIF